MEQGTRKAEQGRLKLVVFAAFAEEEVAIRKADGELKIIFFNKPIADGAALS